MHKQPLRLTEPASISRVRNVYQIKGIGMLFGWTVTVGLALYWSCITDVGSWRGNYQIFHRYGRSRGFSTVMFLLFAFMTTDVLQL